ncbi:MAG TPA: hypothetical protein VHE56_10435 [Mycobacteriales bacterium]|nr:hypothetical protein [Mycobacteriales bacterium]
MTTAAARKALPVRAGGAVKARPRLVVVAPQRVVGRTPFVLLVGGLLLSGLLSLLMLHTLAAQDAFHQTSLQQKLANLTDSEQRLEQQVQLDSAPAALRRRAKALGMVPSVVIGYHQRPNGRITAHEVAANSPAAIAAVITPTTTTATKPADAKATRASSAAANTGATQPKTQQTQSTQTQTTQTQTTTHPHHHEAAHQ